jgi:nitrogen regulatory protein PII
MKRIEAIIKPRALGDVLRALETAACGEVLVSQVQGMGRHREGRAFYRGAVHVIDTFPKLRVELAVEDHRVDEILTLFCRVGRSRGMGNGKVLVGDLDEVAVSAARSSPVQ